MFVLFCLVWRHCTTLYMVQLSHYLMRVCALNVSKSPICASLHSLLHVSVVNAPFVNISAICSFVPTYFIKTPGSVLILSHNQSRSIRWVLATCRIAGDLPLMHILITASLSSKMTSLPIPSDNGNVQGIYSIFANNPPM